MGGVLLSVTGDNFAGGATVSIGGVPAANVVVWSGTLLTATLPARPGTLGKVPIIVRNPDGNQASRSDLFAYYLGQLPFALPQLAPPGVNVPTVSALAAADFNGDKLPDIVLTRGPRGLISLLRSEGPFRFSVQTLAAPAGSGCAEVGDWDGAQKPDLALPALGFVRLLVSRAG